MYLNVVGTEIFFCIEMVYQAKLIALQCLHRSVVLSPALPTLIDYLQFYPWYLIIYFLIVL